MEYWISSHNIQMGPYPLRQLQHLWRKGELASDTYYYDHLAAQWRQLDALVGTLRGLFTAEEALVRLGQNRETGCLSVSNTAEALYVFVEDGHIVCAMARDGSGEFALSRALSLDDSTYEWFHGARPPATNLRLNITEYVLRHSIARDVRIGSSSQPAITAHTNGNGKIAKTVTMPKINGQAEPKRTFHFALVPDNAPDVRLRLAKPTHVVGREQHCDLIVNDHQVSRKHCLLEVQNDSVYVRDLGSSNGTMLNGVLIHDGHLKVGDQLSLGSYKLILHKEQKLAPDPA
jgi:hypothetical protein